MNEIISPSGKLAIEYGNKAKQHAISAVEYAIKCGDELLKVKDELPHGEYIDWIRENMPVTERQCQKFTSISSYIKKANTNPSSYLESDKSINDLAAEAAQFKARELEKKRAKEKPQKVEPIEPEYHEEIKYKYKDGDAKISQDDEVESKVVFGPISMTPDDAATILGIPGCIRPNKEVLKAIYKFLSNKNHPDKGGDSAIMAEINKAYEELK